MKRALVISGGGSKGAFAVGILQRLRALYPTLRFDLTIGTSTGALIAPFAATGDLDLLEELYTTHTTDEVVTKHRLGDRLTQKSIYTVEPLWGLVQKYITDDRYKEIVQSGSSISVMTTCLQTGEIVVYTSEPAPAPSPHYTIRPAKSPEHMRLAILGSACQPVFMTPVKIDRNFVAGKEREYQYVDGGVREYAGIQMAIDQGAEEIFCILLSTKKGEVEEVEYTSLFPILERTISMFSEDVEKNDILIPQLQADVFSYLAKVKERLRQDGVPQSKIEDYFGDPGNPFSSSARIRLYLIRPDTPLGGGPGGLVFDPAEMQGMIARGKGAADDFAARLNEDDVTWLV